MTFKTLHAMHGSVNPFGDYKRYKTRKAVVLDSLFVKNVINLWFCLLKNYFATVNFRVRGIDSISCQRTSIVVEVA